MKKIVAAVLSAFLFFCFSPHVFAQHVPILMYHHISHNITADTVVSPTKLVKDFLYLQENGYTPISFKDLIASQKSNMPLPKKPVIITFDDGYSSNYEYLFPLLKIFNFKANINIVVGQVGRTPGVNPHFTWEEAKEMHHSGLVEFGVHTYDLHGQAGFMPNELENEDDYINRINHDLELAEKDFTLNLGVRPEIFCYPYGRLNSTAEKVLKDKEYKVTLSITEGQENELRMLHRINVTNNTRLGRVLALKSKKKT